MLGLWGPGPRSSSMLSSVLVTLLLSSLFPNAVGLRTTSGSPCTDACSKSGPTSNTTSSEIVCLDGSYNQTKGENFQDCVSCQLKSTFQDTNTGETDVNWGLYNMRFAFSTCVYGYPVSFSNLSSPCTVSCDGVRLAVETDVQDPAVDNLDSWCSAPSFADNVVNTCEFCYNLTQVPQRQLYLANCTYSPRQYNPVSARTTNSSNAVLEAIRYNCHFPTVGGHAFDVSPTRIFAESLLPSSLSLSTSSSGHSVNLGLVIAVPVVGFVILLCGVGGCCFFFIRWRRKRARRNRFSNHLYARWHDTTISTPTQAQSGWADPQMHAAGYGYGPGFGFTDSDGSHHQVGYGYGYGHPGQETSKSGFEQEIMETQTQTQQQQPFSDVDKKQAL
ncbi:uncharacterized protein N7459_005860 [Penicillium hispanicum]|uniref:uncharacterized protein n=1 Tax=Penicillium hispanicum TaxID=1080232 RepID=UPI002541D78C|nr:uncharacterized protein N7459_005860 [Penicillium hispanicum]KAJ5579875.1 hypothetical protein N7459_005860 [Penicillium hispanicum]